MDRWERRIQLQYSVQVAAERKRLKRTAPALAHSANAPAGLRLLPAPRGLRHGVTPPAKRFVPLPRGLNPAELPEPSCEQQDSHLSARQSAMQAGRPCLQCALAKHRGNPGELLDQSAPHW